jgi:hypothetical protein
MNNLGALFIQSVEHVDSVFDYSGHRHFVGGKDRANSVLFAVALGVERRRRGGCQLVLVNILVARKQGLVCLYKALENWLVVQDWHAFFFHLLNYNKPKQKTSYG